MTAPQKNAGTELAFNSDAIFYFDSGQGRSSEQCIGVSYYTYRKTLTQTNDML